MSSTRSVSLHCSVHRMPRFMQLTAFHITTESQVHVLIYLSQLLVVFCSYWHSAVPEWIQISISRYFP